MGHIKAIFIILSLSINVKAAYLDDIFIGGQPISVLGPLTDSQLRASAVPISASSLPLPTGAAIDRTTALAPYSNRLSDGTDFLSAFDMDNTGGVSKILGVTIRGLANGTPVELGSVAAPFRIDPVGTTAQPSSQSGTWNITNITGTITLPTGASTSALQTTGNSSLSGIQANQTNGNQQAKVLDSVGNGITGYDLDTTGGTAFAWGVSLRGSNAGTPVEAVITNADPAASSYGLVTRPINLNRPTFTIVAEKVTLGNNKSMIALQNTGTSVIRIRKIFLVNNQTAVVTGVASEFRFHRIASFTGGTAIIPGTHDTSDTLPPNISAAFASTISGEGSVFKVARWSSDDWGPGTLDVEAQDHSRQELTPWYFESDETKSVTVRQNQGVHIRCATNTTAGSFTITIVFTTE